MALVFVAVPRPLADWIAVGLFFSAAATDWLDGFLARRWAQASRWGAMLDPIADKVMVILTAALVVGLSGLDGWLLIPAVLIVFREVFVAGLREFLGDQARALAVTRLAKWKTTSQLAALGLLLVSMALQEQHFWVYHAMSPAEYDAALAAGATDWNPIWRLVQAAWVTGIAGIAGLWLAAGLTLVTGWDYIRKASPYLREAP